MCYENRDAAYAAVCKERDELRADNKRLNEAYEAMSRDLERMSVQLAAARRERDALFGQVSGYCHTCRKRNTDFDCHTKCYGHQRGSAWEWDGGVK